MTVKENEKHLDLLNCEISQRFYELLSLMFVREHVTAQKTSDMETVNLLLTQLFLMTLDKSFTFSGLRSLSSFFT